MITQAVVGRILFATSRIADTGAHNPRKTPKLGVRTPESTKGKGGGFYFSGCRQINGGLGEVGLGLRFGFFPVKKHSVFTLLVLDYGSLRYCGVKPSVISESSSGLVLYELSGMTSTCLRGYREILTLDTTDNESRRFA